MARRRITTVLDQQRSLRELFRVRFGDRQGVTKDDKPLVGRPRELPRVTSQDREAIEQVAEVYGGEVVEWRPDEKGPVLWEVATTNPRGVAIGVVPGFVPFTSAYEQWARGINTVRCDGAAMQYRARGRWVERPCRCAELEAQSEAVLRDLPSGADVPDPFVRPCSLTTRLTFVILGIERLALARVDTKSYFAAQEVPGMLELLQATGQAGWLRAERRSRQVMAWDKRTREDKPQTRRFMVLVVEADIQPDEVLALERPPSMAQLPAPARPALARGERPQIGPGASIEPVGPQLEDRLPPPPTDIAPVDLDDADDALTGEVVEEGPDGGTADGQKSTDEIPL
ncbi:MAG: hypothetical protein AB7O78_01585 [Thermoleophilia bacterium]